MKNKYGTENYIKNNNPIDLTCSYNGKTFVQKKFNQDDYIKYNNISNIDCNYDMHSKMYIQQIYPNNEYNLWISIFKPINHKKIKQMAVIIKMFTRIIKKYCQ
jgi:cytochrome b involved in lipid metabolism